MVGFAPARLNASITQPVTVVTSATGGSARTEPQSKSIATIRPPGLIASMW